MKTLHYSRVLLVETEIFIIDVLCNAIIHYRVKHNRLIASTGLEPVLLPSFFMAGESHSILPNALCFCNVFCR